MSTQTLSEWLGRLGLPREPSSNDLLNGLTLIALLTKIIPNYTVRLSPNLTPSARINNWNTLINELQKLGIRVGQQEKSRILNGDEKVVMGLLWEVKGYYQRQKEEDEMDISRINVGGDPKSAKSLLQLFILVIIKYYGFTVKEAVALLSNDSKYLAHILAKGFKEKSKPVELMITELLTLLPQITVFTKVKENEVFFLKSIKPGLISKFLSISEMSLELLTAFTRGIAERYQILKNELMPTLVLCLRRHACMLGPIVQAIHEMVGHNKNILTLFLINASAPEVQLLMLEMVGQCESQGRANEAFQQFKMHEFIRSCIDNIRSPQLFANAGAFLLKVVEHNYSNFSSDSQGLVKIVEGLSTANLSKKGDTIIFTNILFALLQQFGRRKNAIAPQILTTAVERYRSAINEEESQNYLLNFLEVMEYFPSIPTTAIIEAILARYEAATTAIRELELDFLQGSMEGLNQRLALRLINNLTKVFVEEFGYVEGVSAVLTGIIRKFDGKSIFESAVKLVKVCLSVHYSNLRKLSYSKSLVGGEVKIDKANASLKLKNLEVERLIQRIVKVNNDKLNDALEPLICYSFFQSELKNKEESEGIKRVMLLLGTEEDLRKLYQNDAKLMLEDAKEVKKKGDSKEKPKEKEQTKMRVNSDASLLNKKRNLFTTLNPPRIPADVQKGLEKYTKNFLEKVGKLSLEEQRRLQEQQRREELRKKMAVRMVEQGINIGKSIVVGCLYQFNSREKAQGSGDYSYLPFYEEEVEDERDVKGLQYFFKRYSRLFKLYYTNYAKLRSNNISSFDDLSERGGLMQSANVWKLLRDHQLDESITVNEVQFIVQRINAHFKKDYRDSSLLDYPAFENFIIQAALVIHSRPPHDMRSRPISEMTQKIVDRFRQHAAENRIDERLFEEGEVQGSKPDELRDLNEKLKANPDLILPEGYKKQTTKRLAFEYKIHLHSFDPAYAHVVEVLDQILNETLGIRIIEPYSVTYVQATAKPILYQTLVDSTMRERSLSSVFPRESRLKDGGDGIGGNLSRVQNKFSKEKRLKQEEKAMRQAEQIKRREERDREIKAMLQKHRERQLQIDRKKQQQRKEEQRKAQQQKRRREKYEQQLKRKVTEYAQKKRLDKEKQEEQARKRKEEEARNHQRLKGDMEVKRRMIEQARLKKKEEENARIQKEAADIKRREEENKIKLLQRKDKTIKMLENYQQKKQREREESQEKLKQSQQSQVNIVIKSRPPRARTPSRLKPTPPRQPSAKKAATPAKEEVATPAREATEPPLGIQEIVEKMQFSNVKSREV